MTSSNSKARKYPIFLYSIIFFFLSLFIYTKASASTYYVSSTTGDDTCTGLSQTPYTTGNIACPIKTLTKVNSKTYVPGDSVLFKKGDTFYGTLTVSQSGTAGNPITFSSYGTGTQPVITGFTTVSGWTNEGNGIYSKAITSAAQTNMVTIDDVNTRMGRYPNADQANGGYLTYESFNSNVSITDNQLTETPNWIGAEVVIRKNDWTLDRDKITDHTGNTLTYTSLGTNQDGTANYGYFIQNDLRTLDTYGEWYHDKNANKFYMYFGGVNPTTKTVKVATLNNLIVNNNGADYVTFDNLAFTGSIDLGVNFHWQNDHFTMQNCDMSFTGSDGVRVFGDYGVINNNQITNALGYGIYTYGSHFTITNNTIKEISVIPGQSKGWLQLNGIFVDGPSGSIGSLIQHNDIEDIGYDGIGISSNVNNIDVLNNFINNSCLILNDGGGIYLSGTHSGILIDGNIIFNSVGSNAGTPNGVLMAEGIYLDESANHITVTNNTVANNSYSGIKLHKANNNIIEDNTLFNNYAGINFENWTGNSTIYGNVINRNIFFAKTSTQLALRFRNTTNDIPSFGTADNNYYIRPIKDDYVFDVSQPSIGQMIKTLAEWKTFTGQDANSHKSPISITNVNDLHFEYNATTSNKVVSLSEPMIDVTGTKYIGSVTLLPYTSIVLIKDPNPAQSDTTPPLISTFTIPSTSTSLTVPITTFTATDAVGVTGYLLTETSTTPSAASGSWTNSATTSYTFSSQGSKTLYAWAKDAAGNVSASASDTVTITLPVNTYTLTINKTGTGSGTVTGASTYNSGTVISTTATPSTGSTFSSWTGDCNASGQVTMTSNKVCIATFTLNEVTPPPSGGGGGGGGGGTFTPTQADKTKAIDPKKDGTINIFDFNILMANWNKDYTSLSKDASLLKGDLNGDGQINIFDINLLMVYWGVGYTL